MASSGHHAHSVGSSDVAMESAGSAQYGSDDQHKSPLDRLGFTKFITGEKKTRDGQTPKRRGPKPDSKPALTRRQELNRQAQRTHRERKEMYIKALEAEVLRLKEVFQDSSKERETMASEIRRLRDLLSAHGIASEAPPGSLAFESIGTMSSAASHTGSSNYGGTASTGQTSPPHRSAAMSLSPSSNPQSAVPALLNHDQVGIDFVLALERPCMDHMQFLMVRSQDSESEVSGHALMASCPPESHIVNHPKVPYPHKVPDMGMTDLVKLLDLSNRLPLDGEITPVMAWASIYSHPRRDELTEADFEAMKVDLLAKVRFGAVIEEFEVKDALSAVLTPKDVAYAEQAGMDFYDERMKNDTAYVQLT